MLSVLYFEMDCWLEAYFFHACLFPTRKGEISHSYSNPFVSRQQHFNRTQRFDKRQISQGFQLSVFLAICTKCVKFKTDLILFRVLRNSYITQLKKKHHPSFVVMSSRCIAEVLTYKDQLDFLRHVVATATARENPLKVCLFLWIFMPPPLHQNILVIEDK